MDSKKIKLLLLLLLVLVFVISCIHPIYPHEMYLQHSATVMMIIILRIKTMKNDRIT